jgi:hypothetical protein
MRAEITASERERNMNPPGLDYLPGRSWQVVAQARSGMRIAATSTMLRCGIPPHVSSRGNAAMTATGMEDVLKKLDLRTSRIEQMLPTLATKEDLKAFATKADLDEVKTHLSVRIESVEDKLGPIAEHLADLSQRLPPTS